MTVLCEEIVEAPADKDGARDPDMHHVFCCQCQGCVAGRFRALCGTLAYAQGIPVSQGLPENICLVCVDLMDAPCVTCGAA